MAPPPLNRSYMLKKSKIKNYDYSKNFKSGFLAHKGINYCNIYPHQQEFYKTQAFNFNEKFSSEPKETEYEY